MHIYALKMTIWANNAWSKVVSLFNESRFIRSNTILVRLRMNAPILVCLHLIPIFNCNLGSRISPKRALRINMSELRRLRLTVAFTIHHRVIIFTNKRIVFAVNWIFRFTYWKFTWFLVTRSVKSLNSSDSHWLCIRPCWRAFWTRFIVIVLWYFLPIDL